MNIKKQIKTYIHKNPQVLNRRPYVKKRIYVWQNAELAIALYKATK